MSEPQDTYYAARRAHGTVVTLACTRPEETCFCPAFGIDPAAPQGDISCWIEDETLFWQANTEKGEALTAKLPMLEDTDDAAVAAQQEKTRALLKKLPLAGLDLSAVGAGKTKELFDRPEWKQLSESCLGCGTCTFVCPTCQCYDIKEFDSGKLVQPLPLLGQLHVLGFHEDVRRSAAPDAARALPAALHAQAGLFPG